MPAPSTTRAEVGDGRLPVPAAWQADVRSAVDAFVADRGLSRDAVAVSGVDEVDGVPGLVVRLVVAGRTWIVHVRDGRVTGAER